MAGNTGLEPILPQSKCGVLPLHKFPLFCALPTFQPERRGVRATSYGRSLYHKGEGMSINSKPSLIICYQRRKVNSFLVQSLCIHQLSCREPPTASALLTAPARAARFHTNTATVLKLRRFLQVLPLNT